LVDRLKKLCIKSVGKVVYLFTAVTVGGANLEAVEPAEHVGLHHHELRNPVHFNSVLKSH